MKKYLSAAALVFLVCSCSTINKKVGVEDDNLIEETAEFLIDQKTGLNIDLTPSTPEKTKIPIILMLILIVALTGCTYSITMVHTEGVASDVVDETDTVSPSTSVTIPMSPLP
jgi:hypothetical protein